MSLYVAICIYRDVGCRAQVFLSQGDGSSLRLWLPKKRSKLYEFFWSSELPLTFVLELPLLVAWSLPSWAFTLLALPLCLRRTLDDEFIGSTA